MLCFRVSGMLALLELEKCVSDALPLSSKCGFLLQYGGHEIVKIML